MMFPKRPGLGASVSDLLDYLITLLLTQIEAEQQQGQVMPLNVTVTSTSETNRTELYLPCFSLTIMNDGPNTVQLRIPSNAPSQQLLNGEQITFSTKTARIKDFSARVATAGNSAALRVFTLI